MDLIQAYRCASETKTSEFAMRCTRTLRMLRALKHEIRRRAMADAKAKDVITMHPKNLIPTLFDHRSFSRALWRGPSCFREIAFFHGRDFGGDALVFGVAILSIVAVCCLLSSKKP